MPIVVKRRNVAPQVDPTGEEVTIDNQTVPQYPQPPTNVPQNDPRYVVINNQPPPPASEPLQTFTMEEVIERIEAARKEEKDKLYETQAQLNERLKVFEDERAALEQKAQEEAEAAAEAERLRQQGEQTALERLASLEQEWQQKFEAQEQERAAQQAIFQKERELQELNNYRAQRLGELSDQIDPRFHDFIRGSSAEEIEAALYVAAEKTAQIGAEVQQAFEQRGMVQDQGRPRPTVPVTSGPGFTPDQWTGNPNERTLTAEDIANMPMSEYANPAVREQLLAAASRQVQERGLYGG